MKTGRNSKTKLKRMMTMKEKTVTICRAGIELTQGVVLDLITPKE